MIFITAVHMSGGSAHQHIERVRWLNCNDSKSNTMTRVQAVEFLRDGNELHVATAEEPVAVQVVDGDPPYIRTVADGSPTDNLLALPHC